MIHFIPMTGKYFFKVFNKKNIFSVSKIMGFIFFYFLIFVASVFLTMSLLIKGEEMTAPNFIGKSLEEAYQEASKQGLYLKKEIGNYLKNFDPLTVIGQTPGNGAKIKKKSFIKVFVTPELIQVTVPDLSGYQFRKSEEILKEIGLKRRNVSYMNINDVPADFVIDQSFPPGAKVSKGSEIDVLVSLGKKDQPLIMPDLIGFKAERVVMFFEDVGMKIAQISQVSYPGLESGIVVKQVPSSGFPIHSKKLISIEVTE